MLIKNHCELMAITLRFPSPFRGQGVFIEYFNFLIKNYLFVLFEIGFHVTHSDLEMSMYLKVWP